MPLHRICPVLSKPLLRIFLLPPTVRTVVGERGQYVSEIFKCVVCFRKGLVALEFCEFGVDCSEVGWCEGRLWWGLVRRRGLFKRGEVGHLEGMEWGRSLVVVDVGSLSLCERMGQGGMSRGLG
jgi:hypothetical protein